MTEYNIYCSICDLVLYVDIDALLAPGHQRPLPVVSAQSTLGYLVSAHLFRLTLPVLGHNLQYPAHLRLS